MAWLIISTKIPLGGVLAVALLVQSETADAGGFAVREQSVSGLGAAYAGVAAGYDLSSMFWNPAGASIAHTPQGEGHNSYIIPSGEMSGSAFFEPLTGGSVPLPTLDSSSGLYTKQALVPAMYLAMPVNEQLSLGLAVNSPFGLTTEPEKPNWAGKFEARTSELRTYNFNPILSYKLTDQLALAAGLQIQYIEATLKSAFPGIGGLPGLNPSTTIKDADDLDAGYTLGLLWQSGIGTDIGIGFRSSIEHELEGDLRVVGTPALGAAGVSADLETPEIVTASLRQQLGERTTLLGTVEWTNWSRLDLVQIRSRTLNPVLGAKTFGGIVTELPLNWDDGWFYAAGIEYEANERMTLRTGFAYEESPIQSATQRTPRSPDTNRFWASIGATYQLNESTSFDFAYSHVFFEDGTIDRKSPIGDLGQVRFLGDVQQNVDIVALSIKVKLGSESPEISPSSNY